MGILQKVIRTAIVLITIPALVFIGSSTATAETSSPTAIPSEISNYFYVTGQCGEVYGSVVIGDSPYVFTATWTNDDGTAGGGDYGPASGFTIKTTKAKFPLHVVLKGDPSVFADIVVAVVNDGCSTPTASATPSPTTTAPNLDIFLDYVFADGDCTVLAIKVLKSAPVVYIGSWTNDDGTSVSRDFVAGSSYSIHTNKKVFDTVWKVKSEPSQVAYYSTLVWYPECTKTFAKAYVPSISGKAKIGKKLTAKVKRWSPSAHFTYRWYANGKSIKGATKSTYKISKKCRGKRITVKVTGTAPGYRQSKTSVATKKVVR